MFSLHLSRSLCHTGDNGKLSFPSRLTRLCIIDVEIPFTFACFQVSWFEMQPGLTAWIAAHTCCEEQHQAGSLGLAWLQESSHHIWFFLETSQQLLSRNQPASSAYLVSLQNYQLFQLGLVYVASGNRLSFPGSSFSHLIWRGILFFFWKGENECFTLKLEKWWGHTNFSSQCSTPGNST